MVSLSRKYVQFRVPSDGTSFDAGDFDVLRRPFHLMVHGPTWIRQFARPVHFIHCRYTLHFIRMIAHENYTNGHGSKFLLSRLKIGQ